MYDNNCGVNFYRCPQPRYKKIESTSAGVILASSFIYTFPFVSILETSLRFEFDKLQFLRRERREDYLQDKLLVDVAFGHGGLEVWALQETQKELVHQLTEGQMVGSQASFRQHDGCFK